jgi:uncharacterized membrane protein YkvA (DUF1232 family)
MHDPRTQSPFTGAQQLLEPGMIDQFRLSWRLYRDPRVSWIKNVIPVLAALYLFSPIDLVPDFLIGVGQIDDAGIMIALLIATVRMLPKLAPADVVAEHMMDMSGAPRPDTAATWRDPGETVFEGSFQVRDEPGR